MALKPAILDLSLEIEFQPREITKLTRRFWNMVRMNCFSAYFCVAPLLDHSNFSMDWFSNRPVRKEFRPGKHPT